MRAEIENELVNVLTYVKEWEGVAAHDLQRVETSLRSALSSLRSTPDPEAEHKEAA